MVQGLGGLWVVIGSSPNRDKNLPIEKKKKKKELINSVECM